jgi:hypothetical protein
MAAKIKAAWLAIRDVRKEMAPYFQFLPNKSKEAKKLRHNLLNEFKEILKEKKVSAIKEIQKAYKCSTCSLLGTREPSGTRFFKKCTPRTHGLESTKFLTKEFASVPGRRFWTASSSTS